MKMDKSVAVALIVLVALAGISTGLYVSDILEDMKEPVVNKNDFVEVYYLGYLANGTVFDSSIQDNINITIAKLPRIDFVFLHLVFIYFN